MMPAARAATLVLLTALSAASSPAWAQRDAYPNKSIRMLVPFTPGGGTDIVARTIAQKTTEAFGQSVIVDNRPGAAGTIACEMTVRAAPDGYTVIMVSGSYATNAALYKLAYDPVNDITPIAVIGESGFIVALHPGVPINSIKELIAHDKAKPGSLNYASTGTGGITHLATELFNQRGGTRLTHVPYKGTGPAMNDLLGGQVQVLFGAMPALVPQIKANRLRGLAVTTPKRVNVVPNLPTVGETVPGYEAVLWYAAWGPKGLPKAIVTKWNSEIDRIVKTQEMKDRMASEGVEPIGGPAERLRDTLKRDVPKWVEVVKTGNIRVGG